MIALALPPISLLPGIENPIYQTYALVALALLITAGLILGFLDKVKQKDMTKVWTTYRGWLIMIPMILLVVALPRAGMIIGIMLLAIFTFKEYARATGLYRDWGMVGLVYAGIVALMVLALMQDPRKGTPGWYGMFMGLPVYMVGLILVFPVLRNRAKGQLQVVALALLGFIYLGWMYGHLAFLANSEHATGYLLYLIFAVEINDVAAYTCGKLFGCRKLCSEISPNKTVAGSIGAVVVSMAMPWLLGFSFPHFGPLQKVLTGLIVGIGGQFGDLVISLIKRDIGVKDMGALIPGHGGLLDRVDSLIFTAPLFFHMVRWFYDLY